MSTKIDHTSAVEPHHTQTTVSAKASATPTSSPKISMFAAKSGFVIPKNKLSGSLIPIYRGGKKQGGSDEVNDESIKQGQRKTKWGPDLTQDTAVRKGRAVAYQVSGGFFTSDFQLLIILAIYFLKKNSLFSPLKNDCLKSFTYLLFWY